jgi:hypothetical protein
MSLITALVWIIVTLIVVGVIFWAVQTLLPLIPLPEPFRRIIYVLLVVIMVLVVVYVILQLLGVAGSMRIGRLGLTYMLTAVT